MAIIKKMASELSSSAIKRFVAEIIKRRDRILKFNTLPALAPSLDISDSLLITFVLEGLGAVVILSSKAFVYVGMQNIMQTFIDFATKRHFEKKSADDFREKEDNWQTTLARVSKLVANVIGELLITPSRLIPKSELTALISRSQHHPNDPQLLERALSILESMGLIERADGSPNCTWQGPECFNILGITTPDLSAAFKRQGGLEELFRQWQRAFKNEIFNREILFYRQILLGDITEIDFVQIVDVCRQVADRAAVPEIDVPFKAFGYAILKNKSQTFYLQKLSAIIGRAAPVGSRIAWQVDFDLGAGVSRQHALIAYNFSAGIFELSCISQKHSVRVNGTRIKIDDPPLALDNGAIIQLGSEQLQFLLAA